MSSQAGSSKISSITQESFEEYNESTKSAILNSTKLAVALPMDIGFHRSVDKDFSKAIDACSGRTLLLTNKLLNLAEPNNKATKGKEKLENQEEVLDRFGTLVVDILDQFFERAVCISCTLVRWLIITVHSTMYPSGDSYNARPYVVEL